MPLFIKSNRKSFGKTLSDFRRDQLGSIAPIVGLSLLPLLLAGGVAIDMHRTSQERTALNGATDAACIAVAASPRSSADVQAKNNAALRILAGDYLAKNITNPLGKPDITDMSVSGRKISITTKSVVPTSFMKLAGINEVTVTSRCEITKTSGGVELALVLDTTASMNNGKKIDGAKAAAHTLLNRLYGGTPDSYPNSSKVRVSLVPFSSSVRLDTAATDYSADWIDTTGVNPMSSVSFNSTTYSNATAWEDIVKANPVQYPKSGWNGCVEARSTKLGYNIDDTEPSTANSNTLFPMYFHPDTANSEVLNNGAKVSNASTASYYDYPANNGEEAFGLNQSDPLVTSKIDSAALWYKHRNEKKYSRPVARIDAINNPSYGCNPNAIVPMTYDRGKVEEAIKNLKTDGGTVIPEGLAWGWRVLSPTDPFTIVQKSSNNSQDVIAPYESTPESEALLNTTGIKWHKALVLMTDGDNDISLKGNTQYYYTKSFYSAYGFAGEPLSKNRFGVAATTPDQIDGALDTQMLSACTKIKAKGIEIFVTSFGNEVSDATKEKLKSCASSPSNYRHTGTSQELEAFFGQIADKLSSSYYVSG